MAVHTVRFATTEYTHMYENSYMGRPGEKYRRKSPNELTDIGLRVERWRKGANLEVKVLLKSANDLLVEDARLDAKEYWDFLRGKHRITNDQIRAIAKALGTTVHIMTHYSPGEVPDGEESSEPRKVISVHPSAERVKRKRKAQGTPKPKPVPEPRPYDAEEAARLLAKRFGDRVKKAKSRS